MKKIEPVYEIFGDGATQVKRLDIAGTLMVVVEAVNTLIQPVVFKDERDLVKHVNGVTTTFEEEVRKDERAKIVKMIDEEILQFSTKGERANALWLIKNNIISLK